MATHIFMGMKSCEPVPDPKRKGKPEDFQWHGTLNMFRGRGNQVIIAKGNIIEGIEAKW